MTEQRNNKIGDLPSQIQNQGVEERGLSEEAERVVEKALSNVVLSFLKGCKGMADVGVSTGVVEDSSTQILVPVHVFPEESMAVIPPSPSFVTKHTTDMESVIDVGKEVHRNNAISRFGALDEDTLQRVDRSNAGKSGPPSIQQGSPGGGQCGAGEYETLIQEMSSAVATQRFEGMSTDYFQNIYNKFTEVAQAVNTFPNRCRCNGTAPATAPQNNGGRPGSTSAKMPPEVQQRVLQTLSEVKLQLDHVRHQLLEDKKAAKR